MNFRPYPSTYLYYNKISFVRIYFINEAGSPNLHDPERSTKAKRRELLVKWQPQGHHIHSHCSGNS